MCMHPYFFILHVYSQKGLNLTKVFHVALQDQRSNQSEQSFPLRSLLNIFGAIQRAQKMEFEEEYKSQMVAEWEEVYMDYNYLKAQLKEIQRLRQEKNTPEASVRDLRKKASLYRAFSGLTQQRHYHSLSSSQDDIENQPIMVHSVHRGESETYQTTFLMIAEEGSEYDLSFFKKLDDEFNKVNLFYKAKVEEVIKEAQMFNNQMDALIAFRIKVQNPTLSFHTPLEMIPTPAKFNRKVTVMEVIEEGSTHQEEIDDSEDDKRNAKQTEKQRIEVKEPNKFMGTRSDPLEVLNHVQLNNTLETPLSTIKGFLNISGHTEQNFTKKNLNDVEEQLKQSFIEFFRKLRALKSYCYLNTLAFSKIVKKYDKITSRGAAKVYMKMVDSSYLGSSDEVIKLMERVENAFVKHFYNSNRGKAMSKLIPKAKREKHRVTFSVGFLAGCAAALVLALVLIIRARDIMDHQGASEYMETLFPLNSVYGFVVLHMLMFAANLYFWRRYRVNYSFIFGFKQGTELGHNQLLLLSFGVAVLALTGVLSNLDMQIDPYTKDYKAMSELIPLFLLVFLVTILLCPLNIIYRSNRIFFLTCLFHCICAPLYKVTFPDFFLADQFTSQVQALRSLEFYVCYYGWGDFKLRRNSCNSNKVFITFSFIVAVVPYFSRLHQCLRRLYEEKDPVQGYNGLRYFLTIIAVCLRIAYGHKNGMVLEVLVWVFSISAAVASTYWDIVMDWGLLQIHSKNRLLRDKLAIPHKRVYFIAMVLNVLLRFAWLQTVLDFNVTFLHNQAVIFIVACLEIIRRGIWNFFRLENEHLNNVGKYRAFKSVPLPFNYDEDKVAPKDGKEKGCMLELAESA
ncbi:hypothetical protein VNO77_04494 [Canavalia gladiata]|uniref:Uncharacterized protein n=1 Tax=Canavalia gladiata TaxID=3824 RepID=A0AAN9N1Q6_CANGL